VKELGPWREYDPVSCLNYLETVIDVVIVYGNFFIEAPHLVKDFCSGHEAGACDRQAVAAGDEAVEIAGK